MNYLLVITFNLFIWRLVCIFDKYLFWFIDVLFMCRRWSPVFSVLQSPQYRMCAGWKHKMKKWMKKANDSYDSYSHWMIRLWMWIINTPWMIRHCVNLATTSIYALRSTLTRFFTLYHLHTLYILLLNTHWLELRNEIILYLCYQIWFPIYKISIRMFNASSICWIISAQSRNIMTGKKIALKFKVQISVPHRIIFL